MCNSFRLLSNFCFMESTCNKFNQQVNILLTTRTNYLRRYQTCSRVGCSISSYVFSNEWMFSRGPLANDKVIWGHQTLQIMRTLRRPSRIKGSGYIAIHPAFHCYLEYRPEDTVEHIDSFIPGKTKLDLPFQKQPIYFQNSCRPPKLFTEQPFNLLTINWKVNQLTLLVSALENIPHALDLSALNIFPLLCTAGLFSWTNKSASLSLSLFFNLTTATTNISRQKVFSCLLSSTWSIFFF